MPSTIDYDACAPKLNGQKEGTFAYRTIQERWPRIVAKLVDMLKREMVNLVNKYGADSEEDVRSIMEKLSELRYLMMTDKPLENLSDNAPDSIAWNSFIEEARDKEIMQPDKLTWYKGDWLFVECYLYRFIYGTAYSTKKLRNYDYFEINKTTNFNDHTAQIEESCAYLKSIVAEDAPVHETFGLQIMLKMSLWGNRADMSLSGGDNSVLHQSAMSASSQRNEFILVNDFDKLVVNILYPLLKKKGTINDRRIDIVLDNAGVELVGDILLAVYFLSMGFADKIIMHGKSMPWFVSDVTRSDFDWTVKSLHDVGPSSKLLAEKIDEHIKNGQIEFRDHTFWTYPHAYFEMNTVAPDLYEDFKKSSLIFFKGDLNYRKLVGDRDWDLDTSFETACRGFAPCPFMALRTLKAETVAGLKKEVVNELIKKFDEDNSWMTSGEYAVCQLGGI